MRMGYRKRMGAAALAAFGLLAAQPALAQRCIAPQDVTDTGIYAVPILAEGFRASCTPYLAEDGFFATRGEAFVAPYASIQSDRWPGAFRTFLALANGREDDGTAAMRSDLPPDRRRLPGAEDRGRDQARGLPEDRAGHGTAGPPPPGEFRRTADLHSRCYRCKGTRHLPG